MTNVKNNAAKKSAQVEAASPKSNAETIAENGSYRVQHDPQVQPAAENPTVEQQKAAVKKAMSLLAYACTLDVLIPSADGDREIDVVVDESTGETETVRFKVANRFGRLQRGLLDQTMRQLDYAIGAEQKELADLKKDVRSATLNVQRSEDPTRLRDFIEKKLGWADVIADRIAHAQMLRDAAADAYFDLTGRVYRPYEQRTRAVAVPAPAVASDPLMARAAALLG